MRTLTAAIAVALLLVSAAAAQTFEDCYKQIEALRQYAITFAFDQVGQLRTYKDGDPDLQNINDQQTRWFLLQSREYVTDPNEESISFPIYANAIVGFTIELAQGSGPANFGLAKYPRYVNVKGRRISTGLQGWRWRSFCKTQYASRYGVETFLRAHVGVTRMLDRAKQLGILDYVSDEGGYWEERDVQSLVKNVGEWNEAIAGLVGALDDLLLSNNRGEAPIKSFPDYEHLEARGRTMREDPDQH